MTSHTLLRLVIAGGALGAVGSAAPAHAQGDSVAAQSAPAAAHPVQRVPIAKTVMGDAGIIVNARDDGFIEVAAAGPAKTVLLQFRTLAARAWVDSTARMLRARPRRSTTPRTYRSDIDEAGTSGTMALTRSVAGGESEYTLFFSDDPLGGFSIPIERSEADVFVAQLRRAVARSAALLERPDTAKRGDSTATKAAPAATRRPARPATSPSRKPAAPPATQPAAKTTTPA